MPRVMVEGSVNFDVHYYLAFLMIGAWSNGANKFFARGWVTYRSVEPLEYIIILPRPIVKDTHQLSSSRHFFSCSLWYSTRMKKRYQSFR